MRLPRSHPLLTREPVRTALLFASFLVFAMFGFCAGWAAFIEIR